MKDRDWLEFMNVLGHDSSIPLSINIPTQNKHEDSKGSNLLSDLRNSAMTCTKCSLSKHRSNVVFGEGSSSASFMFVGEAPSKNDDEQANVFAGEAGQLLTKMITAMGLSRDSVYITHVVKCMPQHQRNPLPEELETCSVYLKEQIQLVRPRWIIALGNFAAQYLLHTEQNISLLRGRIHLDHGWFRDDNQTEAIKIIPTFHPVYLLHNPEMKKACWEDLQLAMQDAGLLTKA